MKVKGEVENAIGDLNIFTYYAYRPGFLLNRDNDERIMEKVMTKVPFIDKIECSQVGKVMIEKAITFKNIIATEADHHRYLLKNNELKRLSKI